MTARRHRGRQDRRWKKKNDGPKGQLLAVRKANNKAINDAKRAGTISAETAKVLKQRWTKSSQGNQPNPLRRLTCRELSEVEAAFALVTLAGNSSGVQAGMEVEMGVDGERKGKKAMDGVAGEGEDEIGEGDREKEEGDDDDDEDEDPVPLPDTFSVLAFRPRMT